MSSASRTVEKSASSKKRTVKSATTTTKKAATTKTARTDKTPPVSPESVDSLVPPKRGLLTFDGAVAKNLATVAMGAATAVANSAEEPDVRGIALDTVKHLRSQPETVAAVEEAMKRVANWVSSRSPAASKAVAGATPLMVGGLSDETIYEATRLASGNEEAAYLAGSGAAGMKQGLLGVIAGVAQGATAIEANPPEKRHEKTARITAGLSAAAVAVPALTSVTSMARGIALCGQLVDTAKELKGLKGALHQLKEEGAPAKVRRMKIVKASAKLVKASAELAVWVLDNVAAFSAKAAKTVEAIA